MTKLSVAIIGANGYSGLECAKLLLQHAKVELVATFTRHPQWSLAQELALPQAAHVPNYHVDLLPMHIQSIDTIFLATPHGLSLELTPLLLQQGIQIIDLSGAFRLHCNAFAEYYHEAHTQPQLLADAHYGLSPWHTPQLQQALISNPGCYATAVLMTLLPLLKAKLIQPHSIIIDAKSGVSGAGRQAKQNLLYCESADSFYPYKVGHHQHTPEIQQYCQQFAGSEIDLQWVTQVMPMLRGIQISVYAQPTVVDSDDAMIAAIENAYSNAYANYPLVRWAAGAKPALMNIKQVLHSPYTHINFHVQHGKLYVFACIDNLMKGAASQAIENLNLSHGWPVTVGLIKQEVAA